MRYKIGSWKHENGKKRNYMVCYYFVIVYDVQWFKPKQLAIGTKDVPIEKRGWPWSLALE